MIKRLSSTAIFAVMAVAACSGPQENREQARDLTLTPVDETLSVFNDRPQAEQLRVARSQSEVAVPYVPMAIQPDRRDEDPAAEPEFEMGERPTEPATLAEPPAPPTLGGGYSLNLAILETINTGEQGLGSPVSATLRSPVFNEQGDLVVPAGAIFRGAISEIAASQGRVDVAFTSVEFNDGEYPVEAVTATFTDETEDSDVQDDRPGRGPGAGVAIADTRGEGIGRSPGGPVIVISGGTGGTCNAPPTIFPFGPSTFRRVWGGRR